MFTALFVTVFVCVSASAQYNFCITPDQYEGRCVPVYSCKPMINAFRQLPQPVPTEIQEYLKEFQCGFNDNTPKVCCPATPITFNKVLDQNNFPDVSRHRKLKLLPRECGVFDDENRIVNGNATQLFEYPWMALLSYESRFGPQFKCAGTIINRNYILTAAHCLANLRQPLLGVRIGEYDIKTTTDCETDTWDGETCSPPHQDLKIQRIIIHPLYNSATFSNDIGLIKTAPMDLSLANAKPICLPLGENRNYNFTNRNIIVTGWGVTETGKSSNTLLQVSLPFVPLDECKKQYFKIAKLSETQLCAGGKTNSDSCAGDSGGPLHAIGNMYSEVRLVQQGIVSFGPRRCGMQKIPGVYTRVAAYMDWILDNIDA